MGRAAELPMALVGPPKKRKKKKKKKSSVCGYIRVDLSSCRYPILRIALRKLGWEATTDDTKPWHLIWTDTSIGPDKLMMLKRGQKINHFVGMLEICRKKALARNLSMMRKIFPAAYKFFPRAFILPNQLTQFYARFNSPKPRTYILKPDTGSMGRGVVLVQTSEEVKQAMKGLNGANFVAQKYLTKPLLLNGYKFDLRIYVLILSCDPLRLYLYKEGLARFCTEKYMKPDQKNIKVSRMHLTNYSLNKYSSKFEFNNSTTEVNKGSKWTLTALFKALAAQGFDVEQLELQIKRMVVLTVIAIAPVLAHSYKTCLNEDDNGRSCFELLGLDVLLDEKCKPWLLEVNHSPSFSIDTPLDQMVKEALILDTLKLINVDPTGISKSRMEDRRDAQLRLYGKLPGESYDIEEPTEGTERTQQSSEEYEQENKGNFDRIYPAADPDLQSFYDKCLAGASELFAHSFDMKVKKEIAKMQEEKKQEELERQAQEKKRKFQEEARRRAREAARLAAKQGRRSPVAPRQPLSKASSDAETSTTSPAVDMMWTSPSPALSTPKSGRSGVEAQSDKLVEEVEEEIRISPTAMVEEERPETLSARSLPCPCDEVSLPSSPPTSQVTTINGFNSPRASTGTLIPPCSPAASSNNNGTITYNTFNTINVTSQRQLPRSSSLECGDSPTCLTARGYVKSLSASLSLDSKCAHCQRHQGRALAMKNVNALPSSMNMNDMTALASSFLATRFNLDKARSNVPLKKNVGAGTGPAVAAAAAAARSSIPESIKMRFRSKLLSLQKSGNFVASHPGVFKPIVRAPWDASTATPGLSSSGAKQQKFNFMVEASRF